MKYKKQYVRPASHVETLELTCMIAISLGDNPTMHVNDPSEEIPAEGSLAPQRMEWEEI